MYLNTFSALNHALGAIKTNEYLEICITSKNKYRHTIRYVYGEYNIYYNGSSLEKNKQETMIFLLSIKINSIQIYGSIGIFYVDKIGFHYQYTAANTIQKAWRKYFIRSARLRNDLVIHGLIEYWFHPNHINLLDMVGASIKYII